MPNTPFRICRVNRKDRLGGVTGSYLATIHAVIKGSDYVPYCVANESICSILGIILQLPVPPAAIVSSKSKPNIPLFASLNFNTSKDALPAVMGSQCFAVLPELSTGLLLFDIWIGNSDRHRGNLKVDYLSTPAEMWIFDHSHALFGYQAGMGYNRLVDLRDRLAVSGGLVTLGNRHCLLDHVSNDKHFSDWIGRIKSLPDFVIQGACRSAISLGVTAAEVDAVENFLLHRRNNLERIIHDNKCEFKAIQQWSFHAIVP